MNTNDITIGKTYIIKTGQNQMTVTVIDRDEAKQMWVCETANGKRIGVKDSAKFLAECSGSPLLAAPEPAAPESAPSESLAPSESSANGNLFAKAAAAKIAAQFGFCTVEAAEAIAHEASAEAERLAQIAAAKAAKASAAKIAAEHGFCTQEIALQLEAEAAAAKTAARAAGAKGGRSRSQMSGLDAAYQILLEAGQPMNPKAIANAAMERGIWTPNGATPDMTLSAALQHELKMKGDASRFAKTAPGQYIARSNY
jgi:pyruvate/2-oxoglutarate dehydrogenase complex dihydrolipoamide acyltransferase (E2) component